MIIEFDSNSTSNNSVQSNATQSDRLSLNPILWVDDKEGLSHTEKHFKLLTPNDKPEPGQHIIALSSERDIKRVIRAVEQENIIGVVPAHIAFYSPVDIFKAACNQRVELWLETINSMSLELKDALALASDILSTKKSSTQATIELEDLRKRCQVSEFNWNKFITDLEAEIHASVNGKKAQERHERVRLELTALLKEVDPLKALDTKKFIAQRYGYKVSEIEQLLRYLDQSARLPKLRTLSLKELFSMPQQGIDYVIPGMLPVGECALLVASPKAGKSLLAYDAAFAVATGEDTFLGEAVKQGKVLIIQCDESIGSATSRLIKRGFREGDADNVQFMDSFNIFQLLELEERLEEFRPDLVIIDSLRRISIGTGVSENSAEFADAVYKVKELLFRYNAAGILIHHTNKNQDALGVERVRGSSAIVGAVWGVWEMSHVPKPDPNNKKRQIIDPKDPTRILSITARDIEGQRLKIELDPENNHWVSLGEEGVDASETTDRKSNEAKILELLRSAAPRGLEASEINQHVGLGRGVYCYLNRLLGKRVIGSRPSSVDKRRTVYFFPTLVVNNEPIMSLDPPSPPVCVSEMRSTSESLNTIGLDNRSQIDRKSIAKKSSESSVSNPRVEPANLSEVDRKTLHTQGGGESVKLAINSKTVEKTWVKAIHPKTNDWTAAVLIGAVADGYQIRFPGESVLVVPVENIDF